MTHEFLAWFTTCALVAWVSPTRMYFNRRYVSLEKLQLGQKTETRRWVWKRNKDNERVPSSFAKGGTHARQLWSAYMGQVWIRAMWNYGNTDQFGWLFIHQLRYETFGEMPHDTPHREGFGEMSLPEFKALPCFEGCLESDDVMVISFSFVSLGAPTYPYPPRYPRSLVMPGGSDQVSDHELEPMHFSSSDSSEGSDSNDSEITVLSVSEDEEVREVTLEKLPRGRGPGYTRGVVESYGPSEEVIPGTVQIQGVQTLDITVSQ